MQPEDEGPFPEPVEIPIDGTLDLHTFAPRDVKELVDEYLRLCQEKGILQVRIIHGKGTGVLRLKVRSLLEKDPRVATFWTESEVDGGWGVTCLALHPT